MKNYFVMGVEVRLETRRKVAAFCRVPAGLTAEQEKDFTLGWKAEDARIQAENKLRSEGRTRGFDDCKAGITVNPYVENTPAYEGWNVGKADYLYSLTCDDDEEEEVEEDE